MGKLWKVIEVPGVPHRAPIPMGARIGPVVFSSAISGQDPESGKVPEDPAVQAQVLLGTSKSS